MSVFADEWRDCLREQYKTVVRGVANQTDTQRNLETLATVMYEVGFSEAELRDLQRLATLRADDMPDDYVPPELLAAAVTAEPIAAPAEPEPASEPEPEPEPLTHDDIIAMQATAPETEPEPEPDAPPADETGADDEDSPQQLSLF